MMTSGSWRTMCLRVVGEIETDLGLDLDLVDPLDLVFHGVLDGDDLFVGRVDLVQGAVKGGGLAAARGARDQQDAVGLVDELIERSPASAVKSPARRDR